MPGCVTNVNAPFIMNRAFIILEIHQFFTFITTLAPLRLAATITL